MRTRHIVIAAVAIGSLGASVAEASTRTVRISGIEFRPSSITIQRGDYVRWRFADPRVSHNVKSRGTLRFRSSETKLTGTHTVRFRRAGTYRYVCTIHPNMRGKVVVR